LLTSVLPVVVVVVVVAYMSASRSLGVEMIYNKQNRTPVELLGVRRVSMEPYQLLLVTVVDTSQLLLRPLLTVLEHQKGTLKMVLFHLELHSSCCVGKSMDLKSRSDKLRKKALSVALMNP